MLYLFACVVCACVEQTGLHSTIRNSAVIAPHMFYIENMQASTRLASDVWTLVQRSASQPTFDLNVSVRVSPCNNITERRTAICIISAGANGGNAGYWRWAKGGIGHAIAYLYKCWSFWALQERLHGPVERIMVDLIAHRTHWANSWSNDMMTAMGARFEQSGEALKRYPCHITWFCMAKRFEEGESFFPRPWFAHELIRRFPEASRPEALPSFWVPGQTVLRVGVLNRRDERRWPDAARFLSMLPWPGLSSTPTDQVHGMYRGEEWVNDELSLREQLLAVRRHNVIISPHGAQLANLGFATSCTVALEILPASFMIMEYQQLLLEVGGRPFFLYRGPQPLLDNLIALLNVTERLAKGDMRPADSARRYGGGVDTLRAETVLGVLGHLAQARRECVEGVPLQAVPFDGVPTMGGLAEYLRRVAVTNGSEGLGGLCYRCGGPAPCCAHRFQQDKLPPPFDSYDCAECLPTLTALPS